MLLITNMENTDYLTSIFIYDHLYYLQKIRELIFNQFL